MSLLQNFTLHMDLVNQGLNFGNKRTKEVCVLLLVQILKSWITAVQLLHLAALWEGKTSLPDFGVIIFSWLKGETFLQPWKFAEKSQIMLIYADFPVKIAPASALIIINMTGMQTEQIFGVSIREDEVPFCVSFFFFFRPDKTTLAFLF